MYAEVQFEATPFQLAKDDILAAYTDGITGGQHFWPTLGVNRLK
jgi:hypothetical protein